MKVMPVMGNSAGGREEGSDGREEKERKEGKKQHGQKRKSLVAPASSLAPSLAPFLTFSCLKCLNNLISRKIRLASTTSSKARDTFLMATLRPASRSVAELGRRERGREGGRNA